MAKITAKTHHEASGVGEEYFLLTTRDDGTLQGHQVDKDTFDAYEPGDEFPVAPGASEAPQTADPAAPADTVTGDSGIGGDVNAVTPPDTAASTDSAPSS